MSIISRGSKINNFIVRADIPHLRVVIRIAIMCIKRYNHWKYNKIAAYEIHYYTNNRV
ncbi:MAG: hypothetical protein IRD7MM_05560 [Candidatus Midichloria mitochondrii]|uniref:Uncharacterized protein n=1 Tax=Midichloria mitochondrii (strain IricVA) TaxID=696127 RepID=F7XV43_MIDMI|nr:hypothetical protein midi_00224 [Candidatus Midichloria mitochondrii IricVA]